MDREQGRLQPTEQTEESIYKPFIDARGSIFRLTLDIADWVRETGCDIHPLSPAGILAYIEAQLQALDPHDLPQPSAISYALQVVDIDYPGVNTPLDIREDGVYMHGQLVALDAERKLTANLRDKARKKLGHLLKIEHEDKARVCGFYLVYDNTESSKTID